MVKINYVLRHITPTSEREVILAGYNRIRKAEGIKDDLKLKVLKIEDGSEIFLIISLDLIWVDQDFIDEVTTLLHLQYDIPRKNILISCSHSHSTPETRSNTFYIVPKDILYVVFVKNCLLDAVSEVLKSSYEYVIEFSKLETNFSINRRLKRLDRTHLKKGRIKFGIMNRPNHKGYCDNLISVLWFIPKDKKKKKILVWNYACHPTMNKGNFITADFPGIVNTELGKILEDTEEGIFLQGFAANITPYQIKKVKLNKFTPSGIYEYLFDRIQFNKDIDYQKIKEVGQEIATQIVNSQRTCIEENIRLSSQYEFWEIPIDRSEGDKLLRNYTNSTIEYEKEYAKFIKQSRLVKKVPQLVIQRLSLTPLIHILAINAEVFAEYSGWIRSQLQNKNGMVLTVGYANGMIGYLPTKRALHEGGYETDRSLKNRCYTNNLPPRP